MSSENETLPLVKYAETTPLFSFEDVTARFGGKTSRQTLSNVLYRLRRQKRVKNLAPALYAGALAASVPDRFSVPRKLRKDAVISFHSALEFHGLANQQFQTVYYFSASPRNQVALLGTTYRRVAPPKGLSRQMGLSFLVVGAGSVRATTRERALVDCLLSLDYSGGLEELDESLRMFPSLDYAATAQYLKLLRRPWLYARLGFLLDRHRERLYFTPEWRDKFMARKPKGVAYLGKKQPGLKYVSAWNLMVPGSFLESTDKV